MGFEDLVLKLVIVMLQIEVPLEHLIGMERPLRIVNSYLCKRKANTHWARNTQRIFQLPQLEKLLICIFIITSTYTHI